MSPWTARVGRVTATFGVHPRRWITNRVVETETFVREIIGEGRSGSIWPLESRHWMTPAAGTTYFQRQAFGAGDDKVPEVPLVATYSGDPTITLKRWGNGTPPAGRSWTRTSASVRHAGFLGNSDALAFVRSRLTAPAMR